MFLYITKPPSQTNEGVGSFKKCITDVVRRIKDFFHRDTCKDINFFFTVKSKEISISLR